MTASGQIAVSRLSTADEAAWDRFIGSHEIGSVYHLTSWRAVLLETFPLEAHYLCAKDGSEITGVLPLMLQSGWILGRRFCATPFCTYGGICASRHQVIDALLKTAAQMAAKRGARMLELRNAVPCDLPVDVPGEWRVDGRKITTVLHLDGSPAQLLARLPENRRRNVRAAHKEGLCFEIANESRLGDFYRLYSTTMRDLGTPVYPRRFFEIIFKRIPQFFFLGVVTKAGRAVAAGLFSKWRDKVENLLLGRDRAYGSAAPSSLLYWGAIEYAATNGCVLFDFGRSSRGSGTHEFKKRFGGEDVDLPWISFVPTGRRPPEMDRDARRYRLFVRLWRHLPIPIANRLGPMISGSLY